MVGQKIVKMIRLLGIEGLNKAYDNIIFADEEDPMT